MEDRKNIVIKVKYPTSGKTANPKVVQQWDFKRIGMAAGGLVIFLIVIISVFSSGDDESINNVSETKVVETSVQDIVQKTAAKVDKSVVKTELPVIKTVDYSKSVLRSMLTFTIKDNEPIGQLTSPLHLSKTKPVSVFYFAELNDMKGRTVNIEWLLEGDVITRKKVNISGDHWRMTSRQYLNDNIKNQWIVRVVDDKGQVITQIPFEAKYE